MYAGRNFSACLFIKRFLVDKKLLKIVLINILCLIVLFVGIECYFYIDTANFYKNKMGNNYAKYTLKKEPFENKFNYYFKEVMRKPVGLNYKKKPILFLGCSYAYGYYLTDEETISYKISKKAKRPIYNWACSAGGIQHAYYVIDKMPKIEPEPEYIFYIYMKDHLIRMYENRHELDISEYLLYKIKDGNLEKIDNRYNFIDNSFFLSRIKKKILNRYIKSKKAHKTFIEYTNFLKNEIKEKYPNSKFVIVIYDYMPQELIEGLKKNNIDIIYPQESEKFDYNNEKYKLPKERDYWQHPSGKAWDVMSDILIKEFHL